jgi:hypothetical protein
MFWAAHLIFITPVLRPSPASSEHVTKDIDFLEASWAQVTTCGYFRASQYLAQLRQKLPNAPCNRACKRRRLDT